ncbi:MAG: YCF48-related protein [Candidatus Acidiferrales bacterium]
MSVRFATTLHTEDGGGSWKTHSSDTRAVLDSVAFATPRSGWAVGYEGTILHTEDGGGSWKTQSSGTRGSLCSVAFATPQSGWAVGGEGTILHWN